MVNRTIIPNGIRVLSEEMAGARSVSIGVHVGVGSLDDPKHSSGLAHFTEHSLFQGTIDRDATEISRLIDQAGGNMGAFTGRDYTCFHANTMEDFSPFAIDLLGDILLNSTFPEEHLSRERNAVISEIKLEDDEPFSRINNVLRSHMWPNQPHGLPVAGDTDSVARINREDVIYFTGQNYTPDRLIISAAGAVKHAEFVSQVQDAFWRMLGTSVPQLAVELEYCPSIVVEQTGVSQAYFAIAIPAPKYDTPSRYDLHALNTILGGGISSRLYRSLRESQGLAYYIQSSYQAYRDAGLLWIEGVTEPDTLLVSLESITTELQRLGNDPVDEEEVWNTKMQMRGQHQLSADSSHTRMSRLMTQEFYFGDYFGEDAVLDGIERVDSTTIQHVAQQLLRNTPSCAVVGPHEGDLVEHQIGALLNDRPIGSCV